MNITATTRSPAYQKKTTDNMPEIEPLTWDAIFLQPASSIFFTFAASYSHFFAFIQCIYLPTHIFVLHIYRYMYVFCLFTPFCSISMLPPIFSPSFLSISPIMLSHFILESICIRFFCFSWLLFNIINIISLCFFLHSRQLLQIQ